MTSSGSPRRGDDALSAEAFMALVLDRVPQPVWVVDQADAIIYANPAAVAVLGYDDSADLRGRPSHATVHYKRPDGSPFPLEECPMLRPRWSGEHLHGEEWFVRRDGSMFEIEWWSKPLDLPNRRAVVFSFIDLSDRRALERTIRERDAADINAAAARAAQRRIVERTTEVRRDVARDLHDGAQQRLVNLLIELRLARDELERGAPAQVPASFDAVADQAQAAIDELRALVAGIHPSILSTRGLTAAVESLADEAALPVEVAGAVGRLPETIEANAYFFVAEALTNAVKHARATRVDVSLATEDGRLVVAVRDDGAGGARLGGKGAGLSALADRIGALGGTLALDSPPGGGTSVRAEIPLPPSATVPAAG